jgi:hypothetical protein
VAEGTRPDLAASQDSDELSSQDTQIDRSVEPAQWLDLPFTLGRYVVTERLARGGAGAVFRAHDPELARDVAIKVVRSRAGSDRVRQRLLGEAQAIAKLSHPNVVAVHDVGELLYGERGRAVAKVLLDRARWEAAHGSRALAIASLERAREICRATEGDPALDRAIEDELARQARDHG